jgi:hydrogenase maturation protein HypF
MKTFHIHIEGIVQGVGFRPFVYQLAKKRNLKGWVNNTFDGVHIEINADEKTANDFLLEILETKPKLSVITGSRIYPVPDKTFNDFEIIVSDGSESPRLLLTPDIKLCDDCRRELHDPENRRFRYPFITCTNCGPRYSIIEKLPYDRPNTTMKNFKMCAVCQEEYNNPLERRHFSQTNSCPECAVHLQLFENGKLSDHFSDLSYIVEQWRKGKIVAIKGIGGYLLTCDAASKQAVKVLRARKNRPYKPFALMYPDTESISKDCLLNEHERNELNDIHAPIVLLRLKEKTEHELALNEINDGLSRLGIMIPYTPLYELLLKEFGKPVIATSGNITDSSIIYEDRKAIIQLSKIADIILMNDRDIVVPQDDGVVQFTKVSGRKITLRRSRGKAPVYINPSLKYPDNTVFTTGSMLKSVFGLLNKQYVYISQYLGNTDNFESQETYEKTFAHFEKIFSPEIDTVVTDKHPDYFSTRFGKQIARKYNADILELQHHKAHFYAVLGENNLLENNNEKILGVVWDGTGLGDDGKIWGGEFFLLKNDKISKVTHLNEFDLILADKMVKEPRISALSLTKNIPKASALLRPKFTDTEWKVYNRLLEKPGNLKSTSMGRFFDAVASLLFGYDIHHYDSQSAIKFEHRAADYYYKNKMSLTDSYLDKLPDELTTFLLSKIIGDIEKGEDRQKTAAVFHLTMVDYIKRVATDQDVQKISFSGGVFQNALLTDMLDEYLGKDFTLYFHHEFSPNDESIPFGQLVYFVHSKNIQEQQENTKKA